jgi:hypothetical protein
MRLTRNDAWATLWVGAAAIFYGLWLTGTIAPDMSTRVAAGIVLALGWLGCMSDVDGMKVVYGVDGEKRPPLTYAVLTSIAGGVALTTGIIAIIFANGTMLATLVMTMVALWVATTIRHVLAPDAQVHELRPATPVGKAA